jgi:hypothetical protein
MKNENLEKERRQKDNHLAKRKKNKRNRKHLATPFDQRGGFLFFLSFSPGGDL